MVSSVKREAAREFRGELVREKRNVDNRERKRPPAALATQHISHDTKPAQSNKEMPREENNDASNKTHPRQID